MSVMGNRALAQIAATMGGFFWLPCPSCGVYFGGHEWDPEHSGHGASLPVEVDRDPDTGGWSGKGICPDCVAAGIGCRAQFEAGVRRHFDCEFLPPLDATEGP